MMVKGLAIQLLREFPEWFLIEDFINQLREEAAKLGVLTTSGTSALSQME